MKNPIDTRVFITEPRTIAADAKVRSKIKVNFQREGGDYGIPDSAFAKERSSSYSIPFSHGTLATTRGTLRSFMVGGPSAGRLRLAAGAGSSM